MERRSRRERRTELHLSLTSNSICSEIIWTMLLKRRRGHKALTYAIEMEKLRVADCVTSLTLLKRRGDGRPWHADNFERLNESGNVTQIMIRSSKILANSDTCVSVKHQPQA